MKRVAGRRAFCRAGLSGLALLTGFGCGDDTAEQEDARRAARRKLEPHLEAARKEDQLSVQLAVAGVWAFIDACKERVPEFADRVLSIGGKIEWITRSERSYAGWVARRFEQIVLDPEELLEAIDGQLAAFSERLRAADDRMLVAARADLVGVPGASLSRSVRVPERLGPDAARLVGDVRRSTGATVGAEVLAGASFNMVARVAARAGTGGGVLATGASTSVGSLGLSLGVAILVDYLVSWLDGSHDEVVRDTERALDELSSELLYGPGGVREVCLALARDRQAARADVLEQEIWT